MDDCHVYVYGIDVTKRFSDGQGDMSKVEFVAYYNTDKYFLLATPNTAEGVWYVTGHTTDETSATHFVPNAQGKLMIKGTEDDNYIFAEVKTAPGYSLILRFLLPYLPGKKFRPMIRLRRATVRKRGRHEIS